MHESSLPCRGFRHRFSHGGAGSRVLNISHVEGFNPGFYCVADGPYLSKDDAGSVAWVEAVPDAYAKHGC